MRIVYIFFIFLSFLKSDVLVFNGTTTILEIDKARVQKIMKNGKRLEILAHPTNTKKGIVFVPIGYKQKDFVDIEFFENKKKNKIKLLIKQKKYKIEKLSVDSSKVKPPKKVLSKISREYAEAMKIYSTRTKKRYWSKPFIKPLDSSITSQYGNARIFNKELRSFHGGTDFKAKVGTPIKASNDGIVVLSKKRYYAGGSVVIDHGEGIYTCYYHLSKMPLKVGAKVKQGDIVGYSGKSGRTTGPHLHFTVMVQGRSVDSEDFLPTIEALFDNKAKKE